MINHKVSLLDLLFCKSALNLMKKFLIILAAIISGAIGIVTVTPHTVEAGFGLN